MTFSPTRTPLEIRIEQGIACGWPLDRICDTLHVEPADVDAVIHHMNTMNREPNAPRHGAA